MQHLSTQPHLQRRTVVRAGFAAAVCVALASIGGVAAAVSPEGSEASLTTSDAPSITQAADTNTSESNDVTAASVLTWQTVDVEGKTVSGAVLEVRSPQGSISYVRDNTDASDLAGADSDPTPGTLVVKSLEPDGSPISAGDAYGIKIVEVDGVAVPTSDVWQPIVAEPAGTATTQKVVVPSQAPDQSESGSSDTDKATAGAGDNNTGDSNSLPSDTPKTAQADVTEVEVGTQDSPGNDLGEIVISPALAGPDPDIAPPFVFWEVRDASTGELVSGGTFDIRQRNSNDSLWETARSAPDCTSGCSSQRDRDPDGGEYAVKYLASSASSSSTPVVAGRRVQVTPTTVPAGYEWVSTATVEKQSGDWVGTGTNRTLTVGTFYVRALPHLLWEVRDIDTGQLVPGAQLQVRSTTTGTNGTWRATSDCIGTACSTQRDRNGGGGEFQVNSTESSATGTNVSPANRYQAQQVTAPSGYEWVSPSTPVRDTNTAEYAWTTQNGTSTANFGVFYVRQAPSLFWEVRDTEGNLVPGAQFGVRTGTSGTWREFTDCTSNCGSARDRNVAGGEIQVMGTAAATATDDLVAGNRYQVERRNPPAGYAWVTTETTRDTNNAPYQWNNQSESPRSANMGTWIVTNTASIRVTAGGDRTDISAKTGSGLGFAPDGTVFQAQRTNGGTIYTCVVDDGSGSCQIDGLPTGGNPWNVSVQSVPTGWFTSAQLGVERGSGELLDSYVFQVPARTQAGTVYDVTLSGSSGNWGGNYGGSYRTDNTGSSARRFSNDRLAVSRINPPKIEKCGLKVAFVLDQSNSMFETVGGGQTRNSILKGAMNDVIDGLVGTPTQMAIYTFGSIANVAGNQPLTPLATTGSAAPLKTFISTLRDSGNWPTGQGATNWDAGLSQLHSQVSNFDLVVFFTDGMPTVYGNSDADGSGNETWFQMVEQAIFSANAIKAKGIPVIGLGAGIASQAGTTNLGAITGPNQDQDFYLVEPGNQAQVVAALRRLAGGACEGTLTIQKQIEDHNGNLITPAPVAANDWSFTNTITPGPNPNNPNTVGSPAVTGVAGGQNGFVTVPVTISPGSSNTITVTEQLQAGYTLVGAKCSFRGQEVTTSVSGSTASFTIPDLGTLPIGTTAVASCVFTNRQPVSKAQLTLEKVVTAGDAAATQWGLSAQAAGQTPVINNATTGTAAAGPIEVSQGDYALTETGGPAGYVQTDLSCRPRTENSVFTGSLDGATVTVNPGDDVICTFTNQAKPRITLQKTVVNNYSGTGVPANWILSATGPQTASGPGGGTGQVVNQFVDPGKYNLSEAPASGFIAAPGYDWTNLACVNAAGQAVPSDKFTKTMNGTVVTGGDVTLGYGDNITCTFTNTDKPGSATWEKIDSVTGTRLAGAQWELRGPGGQAIDGASIVENPAGHFTVSGLHWGQYELRETDPPPGYIGSGDVVHTFVIGPVDNTFSLTVDYGEIENTPREGVNLPLTGGMAATMFIVGGGGLLALALLGAGTRRARRVRS